MNLDSFFETSTIQELMQREDVRLVTLNQCQNWQAIAINVTESDGVTLLGTVMFLPGVDVTEITKDVPQHVAWN